MSQETNDIVDKILHREDATGTGKVTNNPADKGGRTAWGISERSNPEAWEDGKVTRDEAASIYERKYVKGPGFDRIADVKLREILVDFGVTSGPHLAIMKLQGLLKVDVDGVLGPKTLAAIEAYPEIRRLINKLAVERIKMSGRVVRKDPTQLEWINGWLERFGNFID